ncbi:MAG: hypothetical protein R6U32_03930 [Candidatus Woesearchaeota archaeon]
MKIHKNASLNISIQAIVILIFAVVILGLGLGFINHVFSKMKTSLDEVPLDDLPVQPTADQPIAMKDSLSIKMRDQTKIKMGYYNSLNDVLRQVTPQIITCKTSMGKTITEDSLPIVTAMARESLEAGKAAGWEVIVTLPDLTTGSVEGDIYSGALVSGTYLCSIGIYGCVGEGCSVDFNTDLIESLDFTLNVNN